MPRAHTGLPRATSVSLSKNTLLEQLSQVDGTEIQRNRVLSLETSFRQKIAACIASLPTNRSSLSEFGTSPFVLLIHAFQRTYTKISEIERDILPAKQFSSMETSAGRMVEKVVMPVYRWVPVESEMHTCYSSIDGKQKHGSILKLATLKSGPHCLNDEMSENFADAIVNNHREWASNDQVNTLDFTYGVLYGTKKQSNKKDWHILRKIRDKIPANITVDPANRWDCAFTENDVRVSVTIRIGLDWWRYLGGEYCFVEVLSALIRACITPGTADNNTHRYSIDDLGSIVSLQQVPAEYNVSLLQRSQLPWLFLMARHFCDTLVE
ncbi:MAG: hypothetical protein EG828_06630 [Deltaproteobacteria bacterium]|nr:hypothetical protein [Deltaproteobacteria bacterium]